jgi:hypothetical protein
MADSSSAIADAEYNLAVNAAKLAALQNRLGVKSQVLKSGRDRILHDGMLCVLGLHSLSESKLRDGMDLICCSMQRVIAPRP